jgi:myo-inositol catabolism protein IolC
MRLTADPTPEQVRQMIEAKGVVVDAVVKAVPDLSKGVPVLLIDAEYGGPHVATAQSAGVSVAMPLEVSGQRELRFENQGDFAAVVDRYHPDYAKVLVRYNPGGDAAMNARQRARLVGLADWLTAGRPPLMLEVLVPPEPEQLAGLGGSQERYDRELRAELTAQAIAEIGAAGVRPRLWKLEGPESAAAARMVADAVRSLDPDAGCLVLGRGADHDAVRRWLSTAARAPGFSGFAVGRTVWWDPLRSFLDGADRAETVNAIARNYLQLVHDFLEATADGTESD